MPMPSISQYRLLTDFEPRTSSGETMHFEYIASAVSHGIMQVQIKQEIPVMFGVLTCVDEQQAEARAGLTESEQSHTYVMWF